MNPTTDEAPPFTEPEPQKITTVVVTVGNSDDRLPQTEWHDFTGAIMDAVQLWAAKIHGEWYSISYSPYQNMAVCFDISNEDSAREQVRSDLIEIRKRFHQDSVAWLEGETELI